MADVRFLRQLPQTFGLSGRRTRTPITESYGKRGKKTFSLEEYAQLIEPPLQRIRQFTPKPDADLGDDVGGGPGMGQVEAEGLMGVDPNASNLETTIGNMIAGQVAGRGIKGAATTGLLGTLAQAPKGAIVGAIPGMAVQSALAPVGLLNSIGGGLVAGQLGEAAGQEAVEQGYSLSASDLDDVQAAGAQGGYTGGLIGQGIKGGLSMVPGLNVMSPAEEANEAASQAAAMAHVGNIAAMGPGGTGTGTSALGGVSTPSPGQSFGGVTGSATGSSGGNLGSGSYGGGGVTGHGDSAGGGGGGTVICTELHRQGLMSDEVYKKDSLYGSTVDDNAMSGYLVWGKPLAALMAKSRLVTAIVKHPALKWANHMAGNKNWFGSVALKVGIPMCKLIAKMPFHRTRLKISASQPSRQRGLA